MHNRTVAYLRVSTADQDNEKFQADILKFANTRRLGHVEFVEDTVSGRVHWRKRKIGAIIDDLAAGDRLLVPELSRLGRSTLEVLEILNEAKGKGIAVYDTKGNLELNGDDIQSKVMATMLSLFAELERDFISRRTKEALAARKAKGVKLGRPRGPGKSRLDAHRDEILALLKSGVPKTRVSAKYGIHMTTLYNWLDKNDLK